MIDGTTNLTHRTILMMLYATGPRRTELSTLKVTDIDSKRIVVHIRRGRGGRDRDIPLSPKLLEALREYWRWRKPKTYLFPSAEGHRGVEAPISDKAVWWAAQEAARRAGIKRKIGPHHHLPAPVASSSEVDDQPAGSTSSPPHPNNNHGRSIVMKRPPFEVADLIRMAGRKFRERYRRALTWPQIKVLQVVSDLLDGLIRPSHEVSIVVIRAHGATGVSRKI
jgi:Phage integrase family